MVDSQSIPEPITEEQLEAEPEPQDRDMREAFATGEYQILLVANKFQRWRRKFEHSDRWSPAT